MTDKYYRVLGKHPLTFFKENLFCAQLSHNDNAQQSHNDSALCEIYAGCKSQGAMCK